ncbi:MAG: hypothetical protein V1865_00595 [bacterium]
MTEEKKKEEILSEELNTEAVETANIDVEEDDLIEDPEVLLVEVDPVEEEVKPAKYAGKQSDGKKKMFKNKRFDKRPMQTEFDQSIIDIARVTRVMAGGKRMRFRACIAVGNKKGKVGIGLAKGADVTIAINKAVNQAKKQMIDVQISNGTIAHAITQKLGAAQILLRPAKKGRGIICGGVMRTIMEMAGIQNVTGKIMGTNNKVSNAKCVIEALKNLKPVKVKEEKKENNSNKNNGKKQNKAEEKQVEDNKKEDK